MDLGAPISGKREAPCRFSCKALSVRLQTPSRTASSFHPGFLPPCYSGSKDGPCSAWSPQFLQTFGLLEELSCSFKPLRPCLFAGEEAGKEGWFPEGPCGMRVLLYTPHLTPPPLRGADNWWDRSGGEENSKDDGLGGSARHLGTEGRK